MKENIPEPKIGNYLIFSASVRAPFPAKYGQIIYDNGSIDHFDAGLIWNKEWYIYIDKLKPLPESEIRSNVDYFNSKFGHDDDSIFLETEGKLVRSRLRKNTEVFLNSLMKINGVVIFPVVLMGDNDNIYAIRYPESASQEVTKLFLDYAVNAPFKVDVLKIGEDKEDSFLLEFYKFTKYDFSLLTLIETVWEMNENEITNENLGILQNEMVFVPKYFGFDSPIVGRLGPKSIDNFPKGNAESTIISKDKFGTLVQVSMNRRVLVDFYFDILRPINGGLIYWAYSDGVSKLYNFFILPTRNTSEFVRGMTSYWEKTVRSNHKNYIKTVKSLNDII